MQEDVKLEDTDLLVHTNGTTILMVLVYGIGTLGVGHH